jgi:hypothetical protein
MQACATLCGAADNTFIVVGVVRAQKLAHCAGEGGSGEICDVDVAHRWVHAAQEGKACVRVDEALGCQVSAGHEPLCPADESKKVCVKDCSQAW